MIAVNQITTCTHFRLIYHKYMHACMHKHTQTLDPVVCAVLLSPFFPFQVFLTPIGVLTMSPADASEILPMK